MEKDLSNLRRQQQEHLSPATTQDAAIGACLQCLCCQLSLVPVTAKFTLAAMGRAAGLKPLNRPCALQAEREKGSAQGPASGSKE